MAGAICAGCHEPIGYGARFYQDGNQALVHARCFEEMIEKEMRLA
jgi:hypothetical protein